MHDLNLDFPRKERIMTTAAAVCFVVSLGVDALSFGNPGQNLDTYPGYGVLLWGWIALFKLVPAWLANLTLPVLWKLISKKNYTWATGLGLVNIALALSTLALFSATLPGDEAGGTVTLQALNLGFYLWFCTHLLLTLAGWMGLQEERREKTTE